MKNKILIFVMMFSLMITSCSDNFLNNEPTSKIDGVYAFKNEATVDAYRIGMYSQLAYRSNGALYTLYLPLLGDILGEDMVYGNQWYKSYAGEYTFNVDANNSGPWHLWSQAYYSVEMCDNLINRDLSKVKGLSSNKANQYKAEAMVIRAMVLTDIARYFGKAYREDKKYMANPYVDKLLYDPKDPDNITYTKRTSVEDIYKKAIADIKKALELGLKQITKNSDAAFITEQSAHAILARLYLDMAGEVGGAEERVYLPLAKTEAKDAMAGRKLMTQKEYWNGGLSTFNNESILTFQIDKNKMAKWRVFHSFHDNYDGMGDDFVADKRIVENNKWFKTIFKDVTSDGAKVEMAFGDMRKAFFVGEVIAWHKVEKRNVPLTYTGLMSAYDEFNGSSFKTMLKSFVSLSMNPKKYGYYMYGKFPRKDKRMGGDESSNRGSLALGDYSYIRGSEMELIIAECNARLGINETEAISKWKSVASRMWYEGNVLEKNEMGGNDTSFDNVFSQELHYSGKKLIDLILLERRKELLGEGHRFRDILRLGLGVDRLLPETGHYGDGLIDIEANDSRLVFPAPQDECDANENITNGKK